MVSSSWLDGVLKMINNQLQVYFDFSHIYLEHELTELKKKKKNKTATYSLQLRRLQIHKNTLVNTS